MDIFKDIDLFGDSRWKNTPAGPVLDTGIGDLIIEKVFEETGNVKTKEVFDKLREARNWLDDNILAH
jgi:hypothetical protein